MTLAKRSINGRKSQATLEAEGKAKSEQVVLNANLLEKHRNYKIMFQHWSKIRDFIDGNPDTIQSYIRKLPGHEKAEADLYKQQAYFIPVVARTQEAFSGLIMNPEPVITMPEEMEPYKKDVTNDGEPVVRMIARTVQEVIGLSRCAVLVDFPRIEGEAKELSVAEAEAQGLRAYARFYRAEDILDWRTSTFGGQKYLSFVKLKETYTQRIDEWTSKEVEQVRVLDFATLNGKEGGEEFYRVRIFRLMAGGWTQIGDPFFPQADGEPMDEIPLVVFGPRSLDPTEVEKPLLLDIMRISESHYNNSALLEWALLWVGNPTAVFKGLLQVKDGQGNMAPVRLGSSQGIVTTEDGGADILYLPAEGVGAIRQTMEDKRRDMAAMGARLLADETKGQIARDTAIIQRAGEHSVLAGVAMTVADGWTRVLRLLAIWEGVQVDEDENTDDGTSIDVKLNTDYVPLGLQVGELKDLMSGVQNGTLSSRDLFELLQKRGVIRADKSYDVHQEEVEEDDARIADNPRLSGSDPFADPAGDPSAQDDQTDDGNADPAKAKKPAAKKPAKKAPAKAKAK